MHKFCYCLPENESIFKSKFMIKMSKVFRYFLFGFFALSVLFLASCEEDIDGPVTSTISIGTEDGLINEGDTIIADPGSQLTIGASLGAGST